jgi:tricorn protease
MNRLYVLTLKYDDPTVAPQADELIEVARDKFGGFPGAEWSPDGAYLAYELGESTEYDAIYIWEKETKASRRVTDSMFNNFSPTWSQDGHWLFYIGQREFYPQFSSIEWNFAGDRFDGVFAVALRKDVENTFVCKSDEAPESEVGEGEGKSDDEKKEEVVSKESKKIDFDGI